MNFPTDKNRIFGLDIVRAVAIILVVLSHGRFLLKDTPFEGFPNIKMIDGVDVFFVLSGFLIGGILLKTLNKKENFSGSDLLTFWKRRWFRTLPNYYLILLLNYLVVKHGIINEDLSQFNYKFFFFLQNFSSPFRGFFWESWSLSVEEWFYIITPITVLILAKFSKPKWSYLTATLSMIIFPVLYRWMIYSEDISISEWDLMFRKVVLCRLDSIGYGLFAAWIFYYKRKYWNDYKVLLFIVGVIVILALLNIEVTHQSIYKQVFYFSVIPISVMLLLPLTMLFQQASGIIAYSIQHISKISYSMYLINLALVAEVIRDNIPPQGGVDGILKYILYWIIVVVVSSLLYRYFEKPIMDLRDR